MQKKKQHSLAVLLSSFQMEFLKYFLMIGYSPLPNCLK